MWQHIVDFFHNDSIPKRIVVHALIVAGFLFAVGITAHTFRKRGMEFAEQWQSDLNPVTCTSNSKARDFPVPAASLATISQQTAPAGLKTVTGTPSPDGTVESPPLLPVELVPLRLNGQFHQLQQRLDHHFNQFATYYSWSFASTVMAGVLAAVAAVTLLFITMTGWGPSHQYQKTIFLVATVTATYAAAFPSIFQLDRNVEGNRDLYLSYVSLADEVCSYPWTNKTIDGPVTDPIAFVNHVDSEFRRLNKIVVGFDASKTPNFAEVINRQVRGDEGNKTPDLNEGSGRRGQQKNTSGTGGRASPKASSQPGNKQTGQLQLPHQP
jgi:hypothetical protein